MRRETRPSSPTRHRERAARVTTRPEGSPAAPAPKRLERVGPYAIREELGRGGMGVVYRAFHPELDREVALKLMLVPLTLASPEQRERFRTEAKAVGRLRHRGIVTVHDVGETPEGLPYLVMDLVDGASLEQRLSLDGPLAPREAARVASALAQAVAFAHGRKVLHRDLKPANVLLTKTGDPVVTDFGLARDLARGTRLTASGQLLGTPAYMPPEQARGEVADERADVYGVGATLFETLTGRPPFSGPQVMAIVHDVLNNDPPRPSALRPEVDPALEAIVLRCLEKDPADRYPSARALASDLTRYVGGVRNRAPAAKGAPGWLQHWPYAAGAAALLLASTLTFGGGDAPAPASATSPAPPTARAGGGPGASSSAEPEADQRPAPERAGPAAEAPAPAVAVDLAALDGPQRYARTVAAALGLELRGVERIDRSWAPDDRSVLGSADAAPADAVPAEPVRLQGVQVWLDGLEVVRVRAPDGEGAVVYGAQSEDALGDGSARAISEVRGAHVVLMRGARLDDVAFAARARRAVWAGAPAPARADQLSISLSRSEFAAETRLTSGPFYESLVRARDEARALQSDPERLGSSGFGLVWFGDDHFRIDFPGAGVVSEVQAGPAGGLSGVAGDAETLDALLDALDRLDGSRDRPRPDPVASPSADRAPAREPAGSPADDLALAVVLRGFPPGADGEWKGLEVQRYHDGEWLPDRASRSTTGVRFELSGDDLRGPGRHRVRYVLERPGRTSIGDWREVEVQGRGVVDLDFQERPADLRGRVASAVGPALAGARVTVEAEGDRRGSFSATTGPDGSYALSGLPGGRYRLRVERRGFLEASGRVRTPPGSSALAERSFTLEPGAPGIVEGDLDVAEAGWVVVLQWLEPLGGLRSRQVTSGRGGRFRFADVPVGRYTLFASRDGEPKWGEGASSRSVEVEPGRRAVARGLRVSRGSR